MLTSFLFFHFFYGFHPFALFTNLSCNSLDENKLCVSHSEDDFHVLGWPPSTRAYQYKETL